MNFTIKERDPSEIPPVQPIRITQIDCRPVSLSALKSAGHEKATPNGAIPKQDGKLESMQLDEGLLDPEYMQTNHKLLNSMSSEELLQHAEELGRLLALVLLVLTVLLLASAASGHLCGSGDTLSLKEAKADSREEAHRCDHNSANFVACKMCVGHKPPLPQIGHTAREGNSSVVKAFDEIYAKKLWGNGIPSGSGSADACGVTAREILRQLLFKYHLLSMLDAPCGAVYNSWMRHTLSKLKSDLSCFTYLGVDVVENVIAQNNVELKPFQDWARFEFADLSSPSTKLPPGFDLLLSRDALQHLSYKAIARALRSYCSSGAKFILVGSYLHPGNNRLIADGGTFPINLLLPPFSFPAPLEVFTENLCYADAPMPVAHPQKSLLFYRLADLCAAASTKSFYSSQENFTSTPP